jgi:cyclase
MLKVRVIPTLLHKNFGLVKGVAFDSWRRTGDALQAMKVYNLREVDEIVFLDIAATPAGRGPDFALVDELADDCFVPLTVGGGVRSIEDMTRLLAVGADKVAINSAAVANPDLIDQGAARFGSQCIVVAIDVRRDASGRGVVTTHCGQRTTELDPVAWAIEAERRGAGEILLTSVDRDGSRGGYDIDLVRAVSAAVSMPVVASGGAGTYEHMAAALDAGAAAIAAGAIYHFTEMTPREAKAFLKSRGYPVRIG